MGFAAVMQAETEDKIEENLNLHGIQFNWVRPRVFVLDVMMLIPSQAVSVT